MRRAAVKLVSFIWRRKFLSALIVVLAILSITPIIIITRTWFIIHSDDRPAAFPQVAVLEEQTESFTCGVHALSTVYKAYGLNPEAERIRWRLGADTKALFWMSDSTGSLHPDMFMVLKQDYFDVASMNCASDSAWNKLLDHLRTRHLAVLLIERRENGNLHWVVASGIEGEKAVIYDPLFEDVYLEGSDFMRDHIVSALLVKPSSVEDYSWYDSIGFHLDGMASLKESVVRMDALGRD